MGAQRSIIIKKKKNQDEADARLVEEKTNEAGILHPSFCVHPLPPHTMQKLSDYNLKDSEHGGNKFISIFTLHILEENKFCNRF